MREVADEFRTTEKSGYKIYCWRQGDGPYPWRFAIEDPEGRIRLFAGIPNTCESYRSAAARARARVKWLVDGTFNKRYR